MVELRISRNCLSPFSHQLSWTCQPRPPRRSTQLPGTHSCLSSRVIFTPPRLCRVRLYSVFLSGRPCLTLPVPDSPASSAPWWCFFCPWPRFQPLPSWFLLAGSRLITWFDCLTVHQPSATLVFGLVVCLPRVSVNRWTFSTGAESFVLQLGSHTTCHALSFGCLTQNRRSTVQQDWLGLTVPQRLLWRWSNGLITL